MAVLFFIKHFLNFLQSHHNIVTFTVELFGISNGKMHFQSSHDVYKCYKLDIKYIKT